MAEKGKRDKGGKTQKKKPKLTIKEKRKLKQEKKNKQSIGSIPWNNLPEGMGACTG